MTNLFSVSTVLFIFIMGWLLSRNFLIESLIKFLTDEKEKNLATWALKQDIQYFLNKRKFL